MDQKIFSYQKQELEFQSLHYSKAKTSILTTFVAAFLQGFECHGPRFLVVTSLDVSGRVVTVEAPDSWADIRVMNHFGDLVILGEAIWMMDHLMDFANISELNRATEPEP